MSVALRENSVRRWLPYETALSILLGTTFGVVLLDRFALNILSPFLVVELRLSNGQIGVAASIVSLSWALGAFATGRLADSTGRRKSLLLIAVVVFSLCSVGTGLASSFAALIIARLVMGIAETIGGFAVPALTGFAADHFGLVIAPLIAGGAAVAAGMASLLLTETAPRRVLNLTMEAST